MHCLPSVSTTELQISFSSFRQIFFRTDRQFRPAPVSPTLVREPVLMLRPAPIFPEIPGLLLLPRPIPAPTLPEIPTPGRLLLTSPMPPARLADIPGLLF